MIPIICHNVWFADLYLPRAVLNILTVCLAATVPWLDLLVSLVGAIIMSTQSIMIPAIIDTAAHWNSDSRVMFLYRQTGALSPHRATDSDKCHRDVCVLMAMEHNANDRFFLCMGHLLCHNNTAKCTNFPCIRGNFEVCFIRYCGINVVMMDPKPRY